MLPYQGRKVVRWDKMSEARPDFRLCLDLVGSSRYSIIRTEHPFWTTQKQAKKKRVTAQLVPKDRSHRHDIQVNNPGQ